MRRGLQPALARWGPTQEAPSLKNSPWELANTLSAWEAWRRLFRSDWSLLRLQQEEMYYYETAARALNPITVVLYIISFFAQPRPHDRRTMLFLCAHFISITWVGEGAYMVWAVWDTNTKGFMIALARALIQTLLFHYSLKLRASIGRLPDKDLNTFLIETCSRAASRRLALSSYLVPVMEVQD